MELFERLADLDRLPMHMPGHKRNAAAFPWLEGLAQRDITEIEGFDDLNDPRDVFAGLERRAAALWGAGESVALVNGSTLGVLAGVLSVLREGGTLLMARDSHRSVYHAAELARAETCYLTPGLDPLWSIPLSVTAEEVSSALDAHPGVGLVCVTSPTYEGILSDIASIASVCHRRGVPLLVDEAHGAHLGFGGFPSGAVRAGADLVVQSLHKTLPALTQTAMLHISGPLVDPARVRRTVGMLQSSSPSYLLSASIEGCVEFMERRGGDAAREWLALLRDLRAGVRALKHIRLFEGGEGVFARDPSKLLLAAEGLGRGLRGRRIEPEYVRGPLTLCMTGLGDTSESLGALLRVLEELDGALPSPAMEPLRRAPTPRQAMPLHRAMSLPGAPLPLRQALGRVSGEYAWAYPPGVPFLVPGEIVDEGTLDALSRTEDPRFTYKHPGNLIFCVDLPEKIV